VDKEFESALMVRFITMDRMLRLAKVMPMGDKPEILIYGVAKDQWESKKPETVRLVHFSVISTGRVRVPNYENYRGLGLFVEVAIKDIRGFGWLSDAEELQFFDGLDKFEAPN
jgi:hypothetical protein